MACGCITDGLVDFESEDEDDEETQTQFSKGNTAGGGTHMSSAGESSSGKHGSSKRRSSADSSKGTSQSLLPKNVINESAGTGDEGVLNTPYDKVTPLFQNIEKENWQGVLTFLNTGKWGNSFFRSTAEHMRSPSPHIQARTWVTAYDKKTGEPEWSQLPLHAAISYLAPFVVIQKLVEMFPKAVQCTDREGMLPIHLAFGFGAPDTVLSLLLEAFPASVDEKGLGERLPYECCELGPNKTRGKVYRVIADQTALKVQEEIDNEWKVFAKTAMNRLNLGLSPTTGEPILLENNTEATNDEVDLSNKTLTEFLLELLEDRKELLDLKQKLQERLAKATTTTPVTPAVVNGKKKKTNRKTATSTAMDHMVGAPMQMVEMPAPLPHQFPVATVTGKKSSSRSPMRSTKNQQHKRTTTPTKVPVPAVAAEPTSSYENPTTTTSKARRRSKSPAIFLALSRENTKEKRKASKDRKSAQ